MCAHIGQLLGRGTESNEALIEQLIQAFDVDEIVLQPEPRLIAPLANSGDDRWERIPWIAALFDVPQSRRTTCPLSLEPGAAHTGFRDSAHLSSAFQFYGEVFTRMNGSDRHEEAPSDCRQSLCSIVQAAPSANSKSAIAVRLLP